MEMQRFTIGCHDHLKGEAFLMYSDHINESGKLEICGPTAEYGGPYDLAFIINAPLDYLPIEMDESALAIFVDRINPHRNLPDRCLQLIAPIDSSPENFSSWAKRTMASVVDIFRYPGLACMTFADLVFLYEESKGRPVTSAWVNCDCSDNELLMQLRQLRFSALICHFTDGPEFIECSRYTRVIDILDASFPDIESAPFGYGVHPNNRETLFFLGAPK